MVEIIQGSEDWLKIRLGKVTASRVADVMAKTKTGWSASRANYMAELIAERLTNSPAERFTNAAMQWGTEHEDEARQHYSFIYEENVEAIGFVHHPRLDMSGASPDGLVGDLGLVEIKCPNTATHIETLIEGKIPDKYVSQMQWQMACCERAWCDFVSFDPRLPHDMRIFVARVPFDAERVAEMEREVTTFLGELDDKLSALRNAIKKAA